MSRSGPESGKLVLMVDQTKWSVFKTDKQKKNEIILKKKIFECMLLYRKIQLFKILQKRGGRGNVSLATTSHVSDKKR
jgi:hypothetical protein